MLEAGNQLDGFAVLRLEGGSVLESFLRHDASLGKCRNIRDRNMCEIREMAGGGGRGETQAKNPIFSMIIGRWGIF
jgi:hypothetical protein